ncbi:hypothetical protein GCM10022198_07050 [Klugiella xanthotipulae]
MITPVPAVVAIAGVAASGPVIRLTASAVAKAFRDVIHWGRDIDLLVSETGCNANARERVCLIG